jgi:hypothetical protein
LVKHNATSAESLAQTWNISLPNAQKTIKCTTQKGVRNPLYPIGGRYRTKQAQLRYKQLTGRHGSFYTDTFFSQAKSLNECSMAQIYVNDPTFTKVYPMKLRSEAPDTLMYFIHDVDIPNTMHLDDAPELMHGRFKQICKDYGIKTTYDP